MTVTIYRSTDSSAPVLTGLANSFAQLLDAILVNGYGAKASQGYSKAFASLVCSGTATGGANNKLIDTATDFVVAGVVVGHQVFRTADGKNARVTSITTTTNSNDTLNFTAASPITPTFANLDAYTVDNNLRAYRQPVGTTNGFYLRIDDSNPGGASFTYGRMRGYETMSDVNTGTGPFPTDAQVSGGLWFTKSHAVDGTSRPWFAIGNGKIFYLIIDGALAPLNSYGYMFGDFTSYKTGDAYGTIIQGHYAQPSNGSYTSNYWYQANAFVNTLAGHYVARSYTQVGSSVAVGKFRDMNRGQTLYTSWGQGYMPYPHRASGGLCMGILEINEPNRDRGLLPGLWDQYHQVGYFTIGDTFSGVGVLAGKTFEILKTATGYVAIVETSDTW